MNKKVLVLSLLLIIPAVTGCSKKKATVYPDSADITASEVAETGEYTITWINGAGSSFMMKDGGSLVTKADKGTSVSFYLALDVNATFTPEVTVNDTSVKADKNGYYTFKVAGDTTVKAGDGKVTGVTSYSSYYCLVNGSTTKNKDVQLVEDASTSNLFYIKNFSLNANDKVSVYDSTNDKNLTSYPIAGDKANNGVYTVDAAGEYDIFVKKDNDTSSVYMIESGKIIALGLDTATYDYYIWTWGGVSGWFATVDKGTYVEIEVPENNTNFLIAAFTKGSAVTTGSGSSWSQDGLRYKSLDMDRSSSLITPDVSIEVIPE